MTAQTQTQTAKRKSALADILFRLIKEKPVGAVGGVIVVLLLFVGIFSNFIAPYGMNDVHLAHRLEAPSIQHLLGTDQLGRDTFSRIIYGARISTIIGVSATLLNIVIAIIIGTTSGFFGGKFDTIMQRFVDAWMSFPSLLILITVMSLVGTGLIQIILVLGISGGISSSRVVRSAVMGIRENIYILASKVIGVPTPMTLIQHIIPNIMAPIIIIFSTTIGSVILSEAALSFLGFGLPPDIASWGGMLSAEGRQYMEIAPRLALWPGICLTTVVWGMNIFGDALRDLLDPRMRGGVGRLGNLGAKKIQKFLIKRQVLKN